MSAKKLAALAATLATVASELALIAGEVGEPVAASTSPKAGKAGPPAETQPPQVEDTAADAAQTDDLVTDEQVEFVKPNVAEAKVDDMRAELLDYYVAQGNPKREISATLAKMKESELRSEYGEYYARLVMRAADGSLDFTPDFETPYKAERTFAGETKLYWIVGGVTQTPEEVAEKKLGDPNAPAADAPAKRTLPARKK